MKRLGICLWMTWGLSAQELPSALAISREDANRAMKEAGQNLATEAAKGIVDARVKGLEGLSNLSQKQAKTTFGLQGANKGAQATAIKGEMAKKASWLKNWKMAAGVLEYGEALGQAGGYVAEGDARGAFGVLADTAGKKLSGWTAGAAGTLVAGPLGAVAGSAAGETSWEFNPFKKKIQSAVDDSRDQSYADRLLGYRPSWRDHEASEAKKKREAEKAKAGASAEPADGEAALRKQVEGRLISQNLPAPEGLVNQLVGLIQSRGIDALEAALKECSSMQGTFEGSLSGRGTLTVNVQGLAVSASFADRSEASAGGVTAVATSTGGFTGTFDPVSGNLVFNGTITTIGVAKGLKPTPELTKVAFTGHFTGQGFKGNAVANGQTLSWVVAR